MRSIILIIHSKSVLCLTLTIQDLQRNSQLSPTVDAAGKQVLIPSLNW